ncbi:MAG TPA: inositol monophosphatase family protein, partial [Pyrinomonadaceae bacterium]|nr:inositol monophosphatase family protein [Pyrinomonadaceae bacterium]
MKNQIEELLSFAVELARGAGDITLKYFRKTPETTTKTDGSYVTIADREAEAYMRREIIARFPDDGILGEEEGEMHGRSGRRWIIDPIDGTFAFVHGVPFYGVLIGV